MHDTMLNDGGDEKNVPNPKIRSYVYLVDDDRVLRDSLVFVLEKAGLDCISFSSPTEFLHAKIHDAPGCLILDLAMPEMSGLELYRQLLAKGFTKPVIVLTGCGSVPSAVEAMRIGAAEFLEKPIEHSILIDRIQQAIARDQEYQSAASELRDLKLKIQTLTAREQEVMHLIAQGLLTKQIASKLAISIKTIEVHRSNLSKKLGVTSVAGLIRLLAKLPPPN